MMVKWIKIAQTAQKLYNRIKNKELGIKATFLILNS